MPQLHAHLPLHLWQSLGGPWAASEPTETTMQITADAKVVTLRGQASLKKPNVLLLHRGTSVYSPQQPECLHWLRCPASFLVVKTRNSISILDNKVAPLQITILIALKKTVIAETGLAQ